MSSGAIARPSDASERQELGTIVDLVKECDMRTVILVILITTALVGDLRAQPPQAGDLVVVRNSGLGVPSCLFTWNPGTGIWTTLSTTPSSQSYYISCVRMAPNNSDLLITGGPNIPSQYLEQVDSKTGARTTLATFPRSVEGFNLDHDNTLIATGYTAGVSPGTSHLWSVKYATSGPLTLSTLATYPFGTNTHAFNAMTIDRQTTAAASPPYLVAVFEGTTTAAPRFLRMDRNGTQTTFVANLGGALRGLTAVEVEPLSGGLVTCSAYGEVRLVNQAGTMTTLLTTSPTGRCDAIRTCQDGTIWVACTGTRTFRPGMILKMNASGVVSTMIPAPPLPANPNAKLGWLEGLEIYGSRRLVCNQQSTSVTVRLKSHRAGDAHRPYVLACSFNRRPPAPATCLRFASDYLFLDWTDPLFWWSASGQSPLLFQNFRGSTDASGAATATVNVRASVPPLNLTIFVAGVILNPAGPTVTNTHWFVL